MPSSRGKLRDPRADVRKRVLAVEGEMPQHGHGLATQPGVSRYLGEGRYLVEGVRFQMGGGWVMKVAVTANGQTDTVRFNLLLK